MIGSLVARAGSLVVTGLMGAAAYDGAKRVVTPARAREGAVRALEWGLRGKRSVEVGAEQVRLTTGDLLAEARVRVGEQTPPPGEPVHDHSH